MPAEFKIDSREALEAWFEDKPVDWAQVVAARAALRAFPVVFAIVDVPDRYLSPDRKQRLTLQVFRASLLSWVARLYPAHDLTTLADAAAAAVYAAAAAAAAPRAAVAAVSWEAFTADCAFLEKAEDSAALINTPLWLKEVRSSLSYQTNMPDWARGPMDTFLADPQWGGKPEWALIVKWYQALLPGGGADTPLSYFGEKADIEIATQPDDFWTINDDRSAEDILREIGEIAGKLPDGGGIPPKGAANGGETGNGGDPAGANGSGEEKRASDSQVPLQLDNIAEVDSLGRKRFARLLATRIDELHAGNGPDGLAVNLHAPWGEGKSTVLKFMKTYLEMGSLPSGRQWLVVEFNAWQHEHQRPPWRPFLKAVKTDLSDSLIAQQRRQRANDVRHQWHSWLIQAEAAPYLGGRLP